MNNVYMIADTHFGDENIIKYENRPFANAASMEQALIDNWNSLVDDGDTVYVIGDFSNAKDLTENKRLLSLLKGKKILIMGNHDGNFTPSEWREAGFEEVYSLPVIYNGFFMLSHEPLYVNTNMPYANIYGHVHGNASYKNISAQSFCVSVERIDYKPVLFSEIAAAIKEAAKKQD